jgi:BolA family transcriptional regulator, general stress-responsive regulator
MTVTRQKAIEQLLTEAFEPVELLIKDQSHLHAGHAGASDGRGHFDVQIVAAAFDGISRVRRHQLIYSALAPLLKTDIHALKIRALAPNEAAAGQHE